MDTSEPVRKGDLVRITKALEASGLPIGAVGTVVEAGPGPQACRVQFDSVERTVLKQYLELVSE